MNRPLSRIAAPLLAVLLPLYAGNVAGRVVERASVPGDPLVLGTQGNAPSDAGWVSLSDDGRWLAFESEASNLVGSDHNPGRDLFLLDRSSGALTLVPGAPASAADFGSSDHPVLSGDGRVLVFESERPDLAADGARVSRIYALDRDSGSVEPVSLGSDGTLANQDSRLGGVSRDGRYVVFTSFADNLLPGDADASNDVFLRDRLLGITRLLSVRSGGPGMPGHADDPAIDAAGSRICFHSSAPALVPGGGNGSQQVVTLPLTDGVPGAAVLASRRPDGQPGNGGSYGCRIAADTGEVAFTSSASDLIAGDGNGRSDVFAFQPVGAQLQRVSLADGGAEIDARSDLAGISADGMRVAFLTDSSALPGGPLADDEDSAPVVYDRVTQSLRQLNRALGSGASSAGAGALAISGDGAFAAFSSSADDLVANDRNGVEDIFVAALDMGGVTLVSRSQAALPAGAGGSQPAISADGRYTVFVSSAPALLALHAPGLRSSQLFRFDRSTRQTRLLSRNTAGQPAAGSCVRGVVSADGSRIAMLCFASNLAAGGAADRLHAYLHHVSDGSTVLVSQTAAGVPADSHISDFALSADGSHVALVTSATNLVPGTSGARQRVLVWRASDGAIVRADLPPVGDNTTGSASGVSLSANGRRVAFASTSTSLHPDDSNIHIDVFVKNLDDGSLQLASRTAGGSSGNGASAQTTLSADGRFVAFQSQASDLVAGDTNGRGDIFVHDLLTLATERVSAAVDGSAMFAPRLAADGRFVAFQAAFTSPFPQVGGNVRIDVFIHDRATGRSQRATRDRKYRPIEVTTMFHAFAGDGGWLAFETWPGMAVDVPGRPAAPLDADILLATNPLLDHVFADGLEP
jgi:Tol biopolymer transport system component